MSRKGFVLKYDTTTCRGCGATREQALPCSDCGAKANQWEVNLAVADRRRLASQIRDLLKAPATQALCPQPSDYPSLLSETGEVLDELVSGFKEALSNNRVEPLINPLRHYGRWLTEVQGMDRLRPGIAFHHLLVEALTNFEELINAFLEALVAPSMAEAQRSGATIQALLDRTIIACGQVVDVSDEFEKIDFNSPTSIVRSAIQLQLHSTGQTLAEYGNSVERDLAARLGVSDTESVALDVVSFEFLTALAIDTENFRRVFADAFVVFNNQVWLKTILTHSERFVEDFQEARIAFATKTWATGQALTIAISDRMALDEVVGLISTLIDRPGTFAARALLLASGVKTTNYDKLKFDNGTTHIKRAQDELLLRPMVQYLPVALRNAHAHDGIRYENDTLTATTKHGTSSLTRPWLINQILAAIETTAAVLFALQLALDVHGIKLDDAELHAAMGINSLALAELGASLTSGLVIRTTLVEETLRIEAEGPHQDAQLFTLAQFLVQHAPDAHRVHVSHCDGTTIREMEGPSDPLRAGAVAGDPTASLHLLEAAITLTTNEAPILSQPQLRRWCSRIASIVVGDARKNLSDFRVWGPILLRLRRVAAQSGDTDLERILRACSQFMRTDQLADGLHATLSEWASHPTEPLP